MAEERPPRSLQTDPDRKFWEFCDKHELRVQRCEECGAMPFPPVERCETCGSDTLEWQLMCGEANLFSWCSLNRDYYRGALPLPWDTIMVELAEGAVLISNPHGFANDSAQLGMPLRLVWLDAEDEHGRYRLPVFERAS